MQPVMFGLPAQTHNKSRPRCDVLVCAVLGWVLFSYALESKLGMCFEIGSSQNLFRIFPVIGRFCVEALGLTLDCRV